MAATIGFGLNKNGTVSNSVNQILNCSSEDIAKLIIPSEHSDFEQANKPIKAFNNVLPQRILLKANKGNARDLNHSKKHDED